MPCMEGLKTLHFYNTMVNTNTIRLGFFITTAVFLVISGVLYVKWLDEARVSRPPKHREPVTASPVGIDSKQLDRPKLGRGRRKESRKPRTQSKSIWKEVHPSISQSCGSCKQIASGKPENDATLARQCNNLEKPAPFPWPERKNYVPNYFLNYRGKNTGSIGSDVMVFLHHNKAAGTTTKTCFQKVIESTGRSQGKVLNNIHRVSLIKKLRDLRERGKLLPDSYFGGYAFGACDDIGNVPCSYFTVLRNPYARTVSSHSYCRRARTYDQLCTALDANNATLREWALHQGSFFFRQLIFQSSFCNDETRWIPFIDLGPVPHKFVHPQDTLKNATCWFRQKLIMNLTLSREEHDRLLQYCLDHLDTWFKVLMFIDEFDISLAMMEAAYKLPFHKFCKGQHYNIGHGIKEGMPATKIAVDVDQGGVYSRNDFVTNQLKELEQDAVVHEALRADMMLYQKGLEIFQKQKRIFFDLNLGN